MELNPAKMNLICGFFETYLQLNDEEEIKIREEVKKLPAEEVENVLRLPNSYFERGMKKGIEQGQEAIVKRMLEKGFDIDVIVEATGLTKDVILSCRGGKDD